MSEEKSRYLFVIQHQNERYDLMPYSIARTWIDDKNADIAIYLMYDSIPLVEKGNIQRRPDIQEAVDYLLGKGVPIYTCGFCTRACELNADKFHPGIQVANRHIYYALMTERKVVYY